MYTFESRIRYSETDSEGKLTMASLINYFQDCSTFQSEDLGLGLDYLRERHMVWVLSSWQIVAERYPKLCERVTIGTLPYEMRGFLGSRNFAMTDEKGEYIARANSLWSLLDTETGRPIAVPEDIKEGYRLEEKLDMEYAPRKIAVPADTVLKEPITVKKHHLDTNYHVNNQQFVNIAMDFLPENFAVRQIRAEYKKQAFLDNLLFPFVAEEESRFVVALRDDGGKPYVIVEFS
ncbi:MAG: acyl-[acyl-carrier-protein] thioesterase [Lachnospiraceae bacterium]|nr:acyl-[acyl-carrier-protein] thioesterase [Lachnospiraceae bacterium]